MSLGAIFLILFLLAILFGAFQSEIFSRQWRRESVHPQEINEGLTRVSLYRRFHMKCISALFSRAADNVEFVPWFAADTNTFTIDYFVPRFVVEIEIQLPIALEPKVKAIGFIDENQEPVDCQVNIAYKKTPEHVVIQIRLSRSPLIRKAIITVSMPKQEFQYRINTRVRNKPYSDSDILDAINRLYSLKKWDRALDKCREYYALSQTNPIVLQVMEEAYQQLGQPDKACEFALKAATFGQGDEAVQRYRRIIAENWPTHGASIDELKHDCRSWDIPRHHGIVVLDRRQRFMMGFNSYFLHTYREVLEVRRPLAARMLLRVDFNFSRSEYLVFTGCRIISAAGRIYELPEEQFVISDSEERNIHITVEDEKRGSWILPDLSEGDIIEWTYHLLCHEQYPIEEGKPHFVIVTNLNHEFYPLLSGTVEFSMPPEWEVTYEFLNRPDELSQSSNTDAYTQTTRISLNKNIPVRNTGFYYERTFRNPTVACASAGQTWKGVSEVVRKRNFGELDAEDTIPELLATVCRDRSDLRKALAAAFYYIRDKLKYAAVGSAIQHIGQAGRAEAIIKSGIADCKDKSYLLLQVCRELGLEAELVLVSSKQGILFENLPSDQFDHVFIKVLVDDDWHYLDAANRHAVFGSALPIYQGLQALELNSGRIEPVSTDPPDRNTISITEHFGDIDSDWLTGTFHLSSTGNIARMTDESWKWHSLQSDNQKQSAETVLRNFLPATMLKSYDRISHTAYSDSFEVLGLHRRCQLSIAGNRRIGTLSWRNPILPLTAWRNLTINESFEFYLPGIFQINLLIDENLRPLIDDISRMPDFESDICSIVCSRDENDGGLTIRRDIVIKQKYVTGPMVDQVPESLENIEKALHLAVVFLPGRT